MRLLLLGLLLFCHSPVFAAKCAVYSYLDQPSQYPVGLFKLDRSSEEALRRQIPEAPSGKLCWYTRPDGVIIAQQPKSDLQYIFIRAEGRWVFSEVQELIIVVG